MPHSHSLFTVKKVERLWQTRPASEVSEMTGIPRTTIYHWSREGMISKDDGHRRGTPKKYEAETVEHA